MFNQRMGERRARPRFEIVGGDLWGTLDGTTPMTMKNLGFGGVMVESRVPLPAGSSHAVRTTLDGESHQLRVRVSHCSSAPAEGTGAYVIGLEFLSLTAAMQRLVEFEIRNAAGAPGAV